MPKQAKDKRDGIFRRKGRTGLYAEWVDGTGRRVSRKLTATTMKEAVTELVLKKKQAEKIRNGEAMPVTEDSFAVFVRQFLKYQQRRISPEVVRDKISAQEYERQRGIVENHLLPHFGQMRLALVRKVHVIEYIHKRTGVISDGTIIKEVNTLKHIFSYALELEKIAASPAAKVKMPKAPDGRNRWLNVEEWHRLFAACALYGADQSTASRIGLLNKKRALEGLAAIVPIKQKPLPAEEQWLQQAAALAISLGTRRGELLHVQLPDIDLDLRKILLRRTKNGRPRLAFINDAAMIVLDVMQVRERKRRGDLGPLFVGITGPQLTTAFRRACQRAGIEDFSLHDLRHCYASHLRMNGADLHDLMVLMGHSDMRMTARYSHLSNEHLAATAQRLNGVLTLPGDIGAFPAQTQPEFDNEEGGWPN